MNKNILRYWLLTTEYPPFYGGGIGTYCHFTAKMMAEKGHAVTVFVNDARVKDYVISTDGDTRLVRFNPSIGGAEHFLGHVASIGYGFAAIVREFTNREGAPDCIESQEYLGIAYYLLQFKHLGYEWCRSVPVIIVAHSPSFLYLEYNHVSRYRYPNFWIGEMERFSLQAGDHVISPSAYLLKEIRDRFELTNPRVSVVVNPFRGSPALVSHLGTEIVFFGKLSAQKGVFRLLEYFSALWRNGFAQPLTLIGATDIVYHPENKQMGELVQSRMKDFIRRGLLRIEQKIAPDQIAERMKSVRLVIVPSTVDNLPYVVLEMMALGKMLLVSAQGGQAEIVEHGVSGFIFDHEKPGDFINQLTSCLELSDADVATISYNAMSRVTTAFNFEVVYSQKLQVIESCMGSADRTGVMPFIRSGVGKVKGGDPMSLSGEDVTEQNQLLSVVIPYYNMGAYLDETVKSVRASDYPSLEVIIVNDGTADGNSLEVLEKYRNLPGFVVVDKANGGLATARNEGARVATGKYLAFLDSDDLVMPGYFSRAVNILASHSNVFFTGCWTKYFGDSTAVWPTFTPEPPLILYHNTVNSSALVYDREAFISGGLNDERMPFQGLEDYESVVRLVSGGYNGVVIPEILFSYRVRGNSMIRDVSNNKKLILLEYIAGKYAGFYSNFAADLTSLQHANGPGLLLDNPSLDLHLEDKLPIKGRLTAGIIRMIKRNRHLKTFAYRIYRLMNR